MCLAKLSGAAQKKRIMLRLISSRVFVRTLLFVALVVAFFSVLLQWTKVPGSGLQSQDEFVRNRLKELEQADPKAALLLQRVRDQRNAMDLAVAMRAAEHGSSNRVSALRALGQRAANNQTPYEVQLATIARQTIDISDEQQTEAFFQAHATTCQMLTKDTSGSALRYYLDLLNQAAKDPSTWRVVRDDPVALLLWPHLRSDPAAWKYYEAEREWLAEVIADLAPANADESVPGSVRLFSAEQSYAESVKVAMQYNPLPKKAVQELKLGTHAFSLFFAYGPIIQRAVNDLGLPLEEVLDVLFINGDSFGLPAEEPLRAQRAEQFASELALIRKSRPKVWDAARVHPLALRLNKDVPSYADQLLEKYGANDVCVFLYSNYEQQIVSASAALAHYGDLGFYILKTYEDDPRLKAHLADSRVGILAVPFLVRFGNAGFDKLHENTDWVQRYFNPDGTPKKDDWEWITAVPIVGAPVILVRNVAKGYPSEWSEWGWAAIDIADGALLVASFGTSAGATAGKQVLKEGGKAGIESLAKQEAKVFAKRAASEAATKNGGKIVARELERSALRRIAKTVGRVVRTTGEVVVVAGRVVGKIAEPAFAGARRVGQAWETLPPTAKRWIYRSLLAVGMIITIHERTIPQLANVGEAIGDEVGRLIRNSGEAIAAALIAALRELAGQNSFGHILARWVGYAAACLLLLFLAWRVAPWRRRSVQLA